MNWPQGADATRFPLLQSGIELRPLDNPDGLPWWDRPWIDPSLHKALFETGTPVYWLADPTRYGAVVQNGDLDSGSFKTTPLCPRRTGGTQAVAPRLIGPIDPEKPDAILRHSVTDCLGQRVGVFLLGDVGHDPLARHLLRFVHLPAAGIPRPLFFRFWDPQVALAFLHINAARPDRIGRFLGVPDGPALTLLAETGPTRIELLRPVDDLPRAMGEPELDATELAGFDDLDLQAFLRAASAWLIDTFGGATVPSLQMEAAVRVQIEPLRAMGIRSEYALNFALAGLYVLGVHAVNLPAEGRALLTEAAQTEDARARRFLSWALNHPHRRHLQPKGQVGHE